MKDGTWRRRVLAIAMAVAILAGVTAAVPAAAADNAGWDYRLGVFGPIESYVNRPRTYFVRWEGPVAEFEKHLPLVLEIRDAPDDHNTDRPFVMGDVVATFEYDLKGKME